MDFRETGPRPQLLKEWINHCLLDNSIGFDRNDPEDGGL